MNNDSPKYTTGYVRPEVISKKLKRSKITKGEDIERFYGTHIDT